MKHHRILSINPGSTSTKVAVYDDETPVFVETITHSPEALAPYLEVFDQYEMRKELVLQLMERKGIDKASLTAIVARGGLLPPVPAGAFLVNEDMVWQLQHNPQNEHASNLGAPIAYAIAQELNLKAYVYDPVTVDEMEPLAKLTGLPEMRRKSLGHALNMRAAAHRFAKMTDRSYESMNLIVAHLGGGITLSLHKGGKMVDMISDEEGPFSPERSGGLPLFQVLEMACKPGMDFKTLYKYVKTKGGLGAYLGTNDAREVERMIAGGDKKASIVYEAMAHNISKQIGSLAVVTGGRIDAIIITGGIAHSKMLTEWIAERVDFIAPVEILPGENEMESMTFGALRVLQGKERINCFTRVE